MDILFDTIVWYTMIKYNEYMIIHCELDCYVNFYCNDVKI